MTDAKADSSEVTRIANESTRFNIGPVIRNFNVPTGMVILDPGHPAVRSRPCT
jgi:hypothetical protein